MVLAEAHNPTILHPAFLSAQGIVPPDWHLAEPPFCTPAMSVVKFSNQVVFTAELNKFMVRDDAPAENTLLPGLALRYIEVLPHVHYSAVGVNFSGFAECPNAESWLINRFLRPGPGNDDKIKPKSLAMKLVYPVDNGILNLSCEGGEVGNMGERDPVPSLLITGNYHTSVSPEHSLAEARNAISLFGSRMAHFAKTTETVFGVNK